MSIEVESAVSDTVLILRKEIDRFLDSARKRSECEAIHRRRAKRRYHRSWPLMVIYDSIELSVALHNASELGIAFLSSRMIPEDTTVFIKLFCHEDFGPCVPAIVRHQTPSDHGFLIGCEFDLSNHHICMKAMGGSRNRITHEW